MSKACLILEDGSCFRGKALGKKQTKTFGEIVFNTGITGYQEILTDPSYAKQIVTLTYPEIGNYGVTDLDNQSRRVFASGLIIKNLSPVSSSWRSNGSNLEDFLLKNNLSALYGIDTRALTRRIRDKGAMRCVLSTDDNYEEQLESLQQEVLDSPSMNNQDLTSLVTTPKRYCEKGKAPIKGTLAVLDLGLKLNMLKLLTKQGFDLEVFPANTSFEEISSMNPDGIFLSNGPGDPSAAKQVIETVKKLIDSNIAPIFGVCLGHQILSLAFGARTFKMKFGHRGSNHPVKDLTTNKVFITSQNHGFAVDDKTISSELLNITHRSLNDNTLEGIEHKHKPIFSVQFHPEASPGPHETDYLFEKFGNLIEQNKKINA
ncbi:MAG: glutamine-hydrolyzing carbamoyl-phosphate synthase small subunit [Candidatus Caenarcaniphilales bacterium]|nr:glutamine-hydrolyzing carbamoyl-phosphate synthase small subunit [Candidatus Caenarcaniphilales bacterium]